MNQWIKIKPLSVNECWQGRRFKTKKYIQYEREMLFLIKKQKLPPPPFHVYIILYISNPLSDIDNPVKPLLDILQKKLNFNDKLIELLTVEKHLRKKGEEKIWFGISSMQAI